MPGDDSGQSNIDFLFGVGVFLVTFLYVATFIPGIFVPYQPSAIDLSSVAYRTSAILAEDPGWYVHDDLNGTAWEENVDDLSRVGLADDKDHPGALSLDKIKALDKLLADDPSNYAVVRDKMGLHGTVTYDVKVSVKLTDTGVELITPSSWPSPSNYNVESMERNVVVDEKKELFVDCNSTEEMGYPTGPELRVNVSNTPINDKGIIVRIYNISASVPIHFGGVHIGNDIVGEMPLSIDDPHGYYVTLNGVSQPIYDFTFTSSDIVEVYVPKATFDDNPYATFIGIWTEGTGGSLAPPAFPGRAVYYTGDRVFKIKSVYHPAIMRLEVWSDALA